MEKMCCGIIATGWPTWAFAARDKGWQVVVVITKSNEWHKHIKMMFPGTPIVSYDECENRMAIATKIQVWFSDVDPPRRLRVFEGDDVRAVIAMRWARALPNNLFVYQPVRLTHKGYGGMIDGEWQIHVYLQIGGWEVVKYTNLPSRDMLCIINTKIQGLPCPAPPKSSHRVSRVRIIRPGLYRTDGLCPWGVDRVQVVAPCVFSVTNWVRRHLSGI
jgi:hypothetical protein